jgi:hypothetical protein
MIRNKAKSEEFERKLLETENLSYEEKLAIYDALFSEAVSLGIFSDDNILDGIEVDIRIAKAINSLKG